MERSYTSQQLTDTIVVGDLLTDSGIGTLQSPFFLTEAQFIHLRGSSSRALNWATNFLFGGFGYAINLGPKLIAAVSGESSQIAAREWQTLLAVFVIAAALYCVGRLVPSEKTKLMTAIAAHFEKERPSHLLIGRAK
jgi:hypothetical protein